MLQSMGFCKDSEDKSERLQAWQCAGLACGLGSSAERREQRPMRRPQRRETQTQEVTEGTWGSTRAKGQRTQGGLEEAAASWAAGAQGRQSPACGGVEPDDPCPSECSSELTHLGKRGQLPPSSPVVFSGELREDGRRPEGLVVSGRQRRGCGSIAGGQGLGSPRVCPAPPGRGGNPSSFQDGADKFSLRSSP